MPASGAPIRVCFTASEVHTLGGVPQFLARYVPRLRSKGLSVSVLAGAAPEGGSVPIEGLRAAPGLGKRFTLRGAVSMAAALRRQPRETLLVGNSLTAALLTAVTAWALRRRSLFFVHGLTSRYKTGLAFIACRLAELVAAGCSHGIVVLNEDDARALPTARRVLAFAHGVEMPERPARKGPPPSPARLLCVARHEPQKNLEATFRALAACRTPFTLTVVGEGALFDAHAALIETLGLSGRVTLIRRLEPSQIPWAGHDVFLLCSRSEGMPLSLLEAFSHGLPAIVSDAPGLRGLVREGVTGIVVPSLTGASLDAALAEVTENYETLARAAHEEARRCFDIDASVERLAEILRSAAPTPGRLAPPAGR